MKKLCDRFLIGEDPPHSYSGPVLLLETCLYLAAAKNNTHPEQSGLPGDITPIAGGVMTPKQPAGCQFMDLPADLRCDTSWKLLEEDTPIIIIPQQAVTKLTFSSYSGVKVQTNSLVFQLAVSPFDVGRARTRFRNLGWEQA